MAQRRTEGTKITSALFWRDGESVTLTQNTMEAYLSLLHTQGRSDESLRNCRTVLKQFLAFLPEGRVTRESLPAWRERLLSEGYAVRTVNSRVSTVNALLNAMDCRDFQVDSQLPTGEFTAPELTRQEYLRMLQTAKTLEDLRSYVLTKLFATTGIAVSNLPLVTVEAVTQGALVTRQETVWLSGHLRGDLLSYAKQNNRLTGSVFTQKTGAPLARTQVSLYIQKLGQAAQVPTEKANIRALRQLHKDAVAAIEANFDILVRQAYEHQLDGEETSVGW